jgi:hypothetical protein
MTSQAVLTAAFLAALGGLASLPAADPPPPDGPLIVVDANGKEQKIKAWKFAAGTRTLSWLAPAGREDPKPPEKPKGPVGPEALEVRDSASLNPALVGGFVTLIPLERIRSIEFDDKDEMIVKVATDKPDVDETIGGSTKYRGINKITLEAEVDKGDMGVAEVKFLGGVPKGIKSLRFPNPKPPAVAAAGRIATVTTNDMKKTAHKVSDLQSLYKFADGERLQGVLMFKKTLKVELAKVTKIRVAGDGKETDGPEWSVTVKAGEEETYTLLKQTTIEGKNAVLEGLIGRTAVGYQLFPPGTIAEIQFAE